jgi:hypothetical protein
MMLSEVVVDAAAKLSHGFSPFFSSFLLFPYYTFFWFFCRWEYSYDTGTYGVDLRLQALMDKESNN